jgi:hypothetical protein
MEVNCVKGCGGTEWPALIVGGIGIIVALISAVFARRALKEAADATDAAEASLRIAQEQHAEFVKNLTARADFKLWIRPGGNSPETIETVLTRTPLEWLIEVENIGGKAARQVAFVFTAPRSVANLRWVELEGDALLSERGGAHEVASALTASDGSEIPAQAVTKIAAYIGRTTSRYSRVSCEVSLPNVGAEVRLPVRVKVTTDDLPDGVERVAATAEVVVRRVEADPNPVS